MKNIPQKSLSRLEAFTLVELLIVIAIIAILASLLLPVISVAQQHAKRTQAKLECGQIRDAIEDYEHDYSRFPVSTPVQNSGNADVTYGGTFQIPGGTTYQVGTYINGEVLSNSDVIAILLDETNYLNGWNNNGWTDNTNYMKNPKKNPYLSNTHFSGWDMTKLPATQPQPGIGNDLVYRDPWGNPYVITMDLNEDNVALDAFYQTNVSSSTYPTMGGSGLVGLVYQQNSSGAGAYTFHGNVMVWSAGQDGKVDLGSSAIQGGNKDNIVSWQ
jgi:prepilin-type N-terminal cleavage/methylation domain-containing protein